MTDTVDWGLIGLPLAAAIFAVIINNDPTIVIFAAIGSLAVAIAATAVVQAVGGIKILGSGIDIKDWTLKMTFVTTFLTVFYTSNLLIGLNTIMSIPLGIGAIIFGVFTTMYVFGMFGMASSGGGG